MVCTAENPGGVAATSMARSRFWFVDGREPRRRWRYYVLDAEVVGDGSTARLGHPVPDDLVGLLCESAVRTEEQQRLYI